MKYTIQPEVGTIYINEVFNASCLFEFRHLRHLFAISIDLLKELLLTEIEYAVSIRFSEQIDHLREVPKIELYLLRAVAREDHFQIPECLQSFSFVI